MADKKESKELKLENLVLDIANEFAARGETKKAGALRELIDNMKMESVQKLKKEVLKHGLSQDEIATMLISAIITNLE